MYKQEPASLTDIVSDALCNRVIVCSSMQINFNGTLCIHVQTGSIVENPEKLLSYPS